MPFISQCSRLFSSSSIDFLRNPVFPSMNALFDWDINWPQGGSQQLAWASWWFPTGAHGSWIRIPLPAPTTNSWMLAPYAQTTTPATTRMPRNKTLDQDGQQYESQTNQNHWTSLHIKLRKSVFGEDSFRERRFGKDSFRKSSFRKESLRKSSFDSEFPKKIKLW